MTLKYINKLLHLSLNSGYLIIAQNQFFYIIRFSYICFDKYN